MLLLVAAGRIAFSQEASNVELVGVALLGLVLIVVGLMGFERLKKIVFKPLEGSLEVETHEDKAPQTVDSEAIPRTLPPPPPAEPSADLRTSLARLPTTGHLLLGREDQLAQLTAAWEAPHTHVLSVVAPGGVGKTALVNRWLGDMAREDYRGARRVYGWSFYSQGAGESKGASADAFFEAALEWLGNPDPPTGSPWQRGERLAELIREQRKLLILDGLEPLQEPPRTGLPTGRLKDPGLQALLRNLAASNNGLCLITTREEVEDLDSKVGATVERLDLRELSPEAGAAVLRAYELEAPQAELEEVSKGFGGHALALTLLATYLRDVCDGDVRRWREVPLLEEDAEQGGHAFRVMQSYEECLGKGAEVAVLYLLGLFDRPAMKVEIGALLTEPAIPGLTEELVKAGEAGWKRAVGRLRKARLVSDAGGPGEAGGIDAHPLVRSYFGERLEQTNPDACRAGHLRLYEHLKEAAPEYPDTLDKMQPLFHAVIHGCRGGRIQEAMDEVFRPRLRRGNEHYSVNKLGAWGTDLAALSGFFERPWDRPSESLSEPDQGFVLNEAGFDLRAQGRLAEAVAPIRGGANLAVKNWNYKDAATGAGSLSELLLTLGRVEEAVEAGRESVDLADRSGDEFMKMVNRTTRADALHQAGRVEEARELFGEAEAMQAEQEPQYPRLASLAGYRYCDLLLALTPLAPLSQPCPPPSRERGESPARSDQRSVEASLPSPGGAGGSAGRGAGGEGLQAIRQRAEEFFEWRVPSDSILTIALDHLTLGRTHLALARTAGAPEPEPIHLAQATDHLERAVDGLRNAGAQEFIGRGVLARAALHRVTAAPDAATRDLDEAFEVAERGGMRLHLTDAHLERARLRVSLYQTAEAREDLEAARMLVEETGYHRRDPELEALTVELGDAGPPHDNEA